MHTSEPLVPEYSCSEVGIATGKLNRHETPGTDQIPAELLQTGGNILCSEIHRLTNSILNKEELPQQWKESITVPICKKGDEIDCSNYKGISLLPSSYKISFNILFCKFAPRVDEITGCILCGFQRSRSATDPHSSGAGGEMGV